MILKHVHRLSLYHLPEVTIRSGEASITGTYSNGMSHHNIMVWHYTVRYLISFNINIDYLILILNISW